MKVLKFKRPTAEQSSPAHPISATERKALEAALNLLEGALSSGEAEKLIQGKAIVAWQENGYLNFGLVSSLDSKSLSTEVEVLLSDEDEITVNEYPIVGFRKSGNLLELATAALTPCTIGELALKAIDMDEADTKECCDCGDPDCEGCEEGKKGWSENQHPRGRGGRFTNAGEGSSSEDEDAPKEREGGVGEADHSADDTVNLLEDSDLEPEIEEILGSDDDDKVYQLTVLANNYIAGEMPTTRAQTQGIRRWVDSFEIEDDDEPDTKKRKSRDLQGYGSGKSRKR